MHKAVFTIGDYPKAYIGYTSGRLWNGWATPYFELEEAKRVAVGFDECAINPIFYNEESKAFYTFGTDSIAAEIWKEETIQTEDGIKHLYGIGAYCWVWDEATDQDSNYLAEWVEDFIYEFDTYEANDQYANREEMVEAIKNQLKELTTFQQVYEIWYNEELSASERFEALGKELII